MESAVSLVWTRGIGAPFIFARRAREQQPRAGPGPVAGVPHRTKAGPGIPDRPSLQCSQALKRSCVFSEKTCMLDGSDGDSFTVVPRCGGVRAETRATIC